MTDQPKRGRRAGALDPGAVRFVLVEPQSGGNVGSVARALANLGFSRLSLVRPACDPLGREARMMAVGALGLLRGAETFEELDEALAGAGAVVGTTRRVGRHRKPHWRLDQCAGELIALAASGELAVLFGREDHGLADEDLDRCTHLVRLSAAARYASFNLAQAVLLVGHELRRAGLEGPPPPALPAPAGHRSREAMFRHLEQALRTIGFLTPDSSEVIMRKLRRLLGRAAITPDEVKLLRGVARQTLWAARRAGLPLAEGPEPQQDDSCEPRS
jgi:tRNA/rRNA methyltransferase